jgi:hypothetical protein
MGKGIFAALAVTAPTLAILLFVTLQKDEQTRAERTEVVQEQRLRDAQFEEDFQSAWGNDEKEEEAANRADRLKADLEKKRERLATADEKSAASLAALESSLESELSASEKAKYAKDGGGQQ